MSKGIPKRPELLVAFLANLLAGDTKHQQDGVLPQAVRADVQAMKAMLESLNTTVTTSRGQYHKDAQGRGDYVKAILKRAEQARDAVYTKYGHEDKVLADFGLAVRTKRSKGSTVAKAGKKQKLLAEARAKLAKAKMRMSEMEALVAKREVEASLAAPVNTPEPGTSEGPGPNTGK